MLCYAKLWVNYVFTELSHEIAFFQNNVQNRKTKNRELPYVERRFTKSATLCDKSLSRALVDTSTKVDPSLPLSISRFVIPTDE